MRFSTFAAPAMGMAMITMLSACGSNEKKTAPSDAEVEAAATPVDAAPPAESAPVTPPPAADAAADVAANGAVATGGAVATAGAVTLASLTGDAAKGEKVFAQCKACHVAEPGVNRVGPSLHGVVGRKAGTVPGFNYSNANKNSGVTWAPEVLFTYLEAPQKFMPGTRMAFAGLKKPQDRADVIAYLGTRK